MNDHTEPAPPNWDDIMRQLHDYLGSLIEAAEGAQQPAVLLSVRRARQVQSIVDLAAEHNIFWAVARMREGKQVRRQGWPLWRRIQMFYDQDVSIEQLGSPESLQEMVRYLATPADLLSNDWEVCGEVREIF